MPRQMTFDEERPIGTRAKHPVEELRKTRWWKPTIERHKLHVEVCKRLECEDLIQPFFKFADEVVSSPEAARDDMLAVEGLEPYVAFQRYPAYVEPTKAEQKLDFYSASMGRKLR
jgi:hypothetical protein